jgi:uncharacterized FlaG/YvyC family protein
MQIQGVGPGLPAELERNHERSVANLAAEMQVHQVAETPTGESKHEVEQQQDRGETRAEWLAEAKQTVYRVMDTETGEVIQQIPSDEVMRVARNLEKFLTSSDSEFDVQS